MLQYKLPQSFSHEHKREVAKISYFRFFNHVIVTCQTSKASTTLLNVQQCTEELTLMLHTGVLTIYAFICKHKSFKNTINNIMRATDTRTHLEMKVQRNAYSLKIMEKNPNM
jgi:hypothetical protein